MKVKVVRQFYPHYQPINDNKDGDGVTNWGRIGVVPYTNILTSLEYFEAPEAVLTAAEAAGEMVVLEVLPDAKP
jgi:hypothetical protein